MANKPEQGNKNLTPEGIKPSLSFENFWGYDDEEKALEQEGLSPEEAGKEALKKTIEKVKTVANADSQQTKGTIRRFLDIFKRKPDSDRQPEEPLVWEDFDGLIGRTDQAQADFDKKLTEVVQASGSEPNNEPTTPKEYKSETQATAAETAATREYNASIEKLNNINDAIKDHLQDFTNEELAQLVKNKGEAEQKVTQTFEKMKATQLPKEYKPESFDEAAENEYNDAVNLLNEMTTITNGENRKDIKDQDIGYFDEQKIEAEKAVKLAFEKMKAGKPATVNAKETTTPAIVETKIETPTTNVERTTIEQLQKQKNALEAFSDTITAIKENTTLTKKQKEDEEKTAFVRLYEAMPKLKDEIFNKGGTVGFKNANSELNYQTLLSEINQQLQKTSVSEEPTTEVSYSDIDTTQGIEDVDFGGLDLTGKKQETKIDATEASAIPEAKVDTTTPSEAAVAKSLKEQQNYLVADWKTNKNIYGRRTDEEQNKFAWFEVYSKLDQADPLKVKVDAKRKEWAGPNNDNIPGEDYEKNSDQWKLQTGEALKQITDSQANEGSDTVEEGIPTKLETQPVVQQAEAQSTQPVVTAETTTDTQTTSATSTETTTPITESTTKTPEAPMTPKFENFDTVSYTPKGNEKSKTYTVVGKPKNGGLILRQETDGKVIQFAISELAMKNVKKEKSAELDEFKSYLEKTGFSVDELNTKGGYKTKEYGRTDDGRKQMLDDIKNKMLNYGADVIILDPETNKIAFKPILNEYSKTEKIAQGFDEKDYKFTKKEMAPKTRRKFMEKAMTENRKIELTADGYWEKNKKESMGNVIHVDFNKQNEDKTTAAVA